MSLLDVSAFRLVLACLKDRGDIFLRFDLPTLRNRCAQQHVNPFGIEKRFARFQILQESGHPRVILKFHTVRGKGPQRLLIKLPGVGEQPGLFQRYQHVRVENRRMIDVVSPQVGQPRDIVQGRQHKIASAFLPHMLAHPRELLPAALPRIRDSQLIDRIRGKSGTIFPYPLRQVFPAQKGYFRQEFL